MTAILTGPPLLSNEDFAAIYGRDLADLDEARVEMLIGLASDLIRAETDQLLHYVEDDEVELGVRWPRRRILLPELPVLDVSSVIEVDLEDAEEATLEENVDYRLELGHDGREGIIFRRRRSWASDDFRVRVTYSHGYNVPDQTTGPTAPELPGALKLAVARVVSRGYANPTGARQETIGKYSYTAGGTDAGVYVTAGDRNDLAGFRPGRRGGSK